MGEKGTLSPRQKVYVQARASGATIEAARQAIGLSHTQAYRWEAKPLVREAIAELQALALGDVTRRLTTESLSAVDTLAEVHKDKLSAGAVRVSGAKALLELGFKSRELLDLETRLQDIEKRLDSETK